MFCSVPIDSVRFRSVRCHESDLKIATRSRQPLPILTPNRLGAGENFAGSTLRSRTVVELRDPRRAYFFTDSHIFPIKPNASKFGDGTPFNSIALKEKVCPSRKNWTTARTGFS